MKKKTALSFIPITGILIACSGASPTSLFDDIAPPAANSNGVDSGSSDNGMNASTGDASVEVSFSKVKIDILLLLKKLRKL